jgi:uncharacterized membrane protein YcaP (DUF421 family)
MFGPVDWARVLTPQTPLLEIFVRGSAIYLSLFALLRLAFRREARGSSLSTLLVVVLIADAAQNAMAGDYKSVTDGLLLVAVIIGWSVLLDWAGSRIPRLGSLTHPRPLLLIENGRLLRDNMRREALTEEELWSQLRLQGVTQLSQVRKAYMEGTGEVSVLKHTGDTRRPRRDSPARG